MKKKVLFLCATNGVQSPIAEALLKRIDSEHFEPFSAGVDTLEKCLEAIEIMKEIGIDVEDRPLVPVRAMEGWSFDFVITLSERARIHGPSFPGAEIMHWRIDEIDSSSGTDPEQRKRTLRTMRDQISQRLSLFALVQGRTEMEMSVTAASLQRSAGR